MYPGNLVEICWAGFVDTLYILFSHFLLRFEKLFEHADVFICIIIDKGVSV